MIEQVKVMVDEQTKRALVQLQNALSDLLAPLSKLDQLAGAGEGQGSSQQLSSEFRKIANAVEDATDELKRRISEIGDNQAELFSKFAQLVANQESMLKKLDVLSGGVRKGPSEVVPASAPKVMPLPRKAGKVTVKVKPAKPAKPTPKVKVGKAKVLPKGRKR